MISIIVPVYDGENYIEECVTSIREQSWQNWELLLIDNGSRDRSLEICKRLAGQDERILVFSEKVNRGVSSARNLGVDKARGEYLTFVDADDWVRKDFLERLFELSKDRQADMVVCGYEKRFSEDRKNTEPEKGGKESRRGERKERTSGERKKPTETAVTEYTRVSYLEDYLLKGNTHCWGVLYTRELIKNIRFPQDLSIGEDLLFLIDAAMGAKRIVVTDYPGYQYFINTAGAMEKPFTPSYLDQISCWQQACERLEEPYPQLKDRLNSILLVSTLLVVGKLARLSGNEQKKYRDKLEYCHQLVKEYSRKKEVFSYLPPGYSLKIRCYRYFPGLYLWAYGRWKGDC